MAEAEIISAGLRKNPLIFYDSAGIPYGSYGRNRPGSVDYGVSIVYPIDYSGKRQAKIEAAEAARSVRLAQYQNAVRLEIDNLGTIFIDVLDARDAVRTAEAALSRLDRLLAEARRTGAGEETIEDLYIERQTTALRHEDEHKRYLRTRQELVEMLSWPVEVAGNLRVRGTLQDEAPTAPPAETLLAVAMEHRPDLIAHRLGIRHAFKEHARARAERFPSAYALYTPFGYTDNRAPGEHDVRTWGAGVFLSLPVLDRNQGNIRRSEVNISRTQVELTGLERQIVTEVQVAAQEYFGTLHDLRQLEREILPLVLRKRDRVERKYRAGEISESEYLSSLGQHSSSIQHYRRLLVRHRRSMLAVNTAVGRRIMP